MELLLFHGGSGVADGEQQLSTAHSDDSFVLISTSPRLASLLTENKNLRCPRTVRSACLSRMPISPPQRLAMTTVVEGFST
jgi:hypothetical protein